MDSLGRFGELGIMLSTALSPNHAMAGAPMIELRDAGRRFRRHWAVRGIDLAVAPGEMLGIVGADGAGKTTLLQMCAAILDPSEGACTVLGYDTVKASKAITSRIGYMSQGFTLYDRLSVEENLTFSARLRDITPDAYTDWRRELLEMAGLSAFLTRAAGKLSGGMRKKLALCVNLIHEPPLLILDEPSLGVDPMSRNQLWHMLERFRERGVTIAVATSYMEEAERCDRVLLLQKGASLGVDRPEALRQTVEGRVYDLSAGNPDAAAMDLERHEQIFGIQVLPDRVRFQTTSGALSGEDGSLGVAGARPAAATLEDVFVRQASGHAGDPGQERPDVQFEATGAIEAKRLSVTFGEFRAVDSVSLEVAPGTLLALLGPNGAGKTTLIRAFCGLQPISAGEAWIAETRVTMGASSIRQRIGYMSQHFSLYPDLTVNENLSFFAAAYGMKGDEAMNAIRWANAMTGLANSDPRTPVSALSGATRQQLALACSILHRPSVLFLDEPTSGVDPVSRYRFWRLIRMLAAGGLVVVVTTHYLNEAEYCDRIGLMHKGRLIAQGSLRELRRQTGNDDTASVEAVFVSAIRHAEREAP